MKIQPFEHSDIEFLPALQPPDWTNIIPHFQFYMNSTYCFPVKVMHNEQLVGVGTSILHEDTAWLAHIIVHPEQRNQGIGKVLTQALLDGIDRTIFKTVYLMATPLGEPVYNKLGFVHETEQLFFNEGRPFSQYRIPSGIMPLNEEYREDLLKLDREVSGENRYVRLVEHLSDAWVFVSDRQLKGYYLPGLAEGLVVANDATAGLHLMQYRLINNAIAILPKDNTVALKFLYDNGYKVFRKAQRMRLGETRAWQAHHFYNRVSGQIG